ncbi:MAG: hypothetical protein AAGI66_07820 [Cyanobacteria bacterium P01_H01_bin.74]
MFNFPTNNSFSGFYNTALQSNMSGINPYLGSSANAFGGFGGYYPSMGGSTGSFGSFGNTGGFSTASTSPFGNTNGFGSNTGFDLGAQLAQLRAEQRAGGFNPASYIIRSSNFGGALSGTNEFIQEMQYRDSMRKSGIDPDTGLSLNATGSIESLLSGIAGDSISTDGGGGYSIGDMAMDMVMQELVYDRLNSSFFA